MKDHLITALANNEIRAFAVNTTNLVEEARKTHNYYPIPTAALGRVLTAGLMMGDMLKNDDDLLTIIIEGDGPLKQIVVSADKNGIVKGYAAVPDVDLPPKENGHLNVSGAIGLGTLTVIKDYKLKTPYSSTIDLVTSEIAEDLTYYFFQSEQTPSAIGLGVLFDKESASIKAAGGFIVQLMPFTSEENIARLEKNLASITSVTDILKENPDPVHLLEKVLDGFDVVYNEKKDVFFRCDCSHENALNALKTLSTKDLEEMIKEGKDAEITCDFCGKVYKYPVSKLEKLLKKED